MTGNDSTSDGQDRDEGDVAFAGLDVDSADVALVIDLLEGIAIGDLAVVERVVHPDIPWDYVDHKTEQSHNLIGAIQLKRFLASELLGRPREIHWASTHRQFVFVLEEAEGPDGALRWRHGAFKVMKGVVVNAWITDDNKRLASWSEGMTEVPENVPE